jgi:2-polyprenyl-3-methyl-5-hydroxy-6-metoxy-1,4-benzoquinol methylase
LEPHAKRRISMSCYLCAGTEFTTRKGGVRDDPSLEILECNGCGLVALSSLEHIRAGHYETSGMHGDELPSMESWLRESERDDRRRVEMLRSRLANRRVMDFGSGAGGFVNEATGLAAEVCGIEPERRVHEYWGERLRLFEDLDSVDGEFDLITAFHVIEHLPDPRSILQKLEKRLNDGGRLVVEVPSADDALLTLYECDAFQRFTYWSQHLFLFTPDTLTQLAVQAGLKVTGIQQLQRYPLSNHLHWLSKGRPGGHESWSFLDTRALSDAYSAALGAIGKCDTLVAHLTRKDT